MLRHSQQRNGGAVLTPYYTDIIFVLCPSIPTAFTHTRCISPSVTAFLFFIRRATSLLRGRQGRSAPRTEINCFGKEDNNERNPSVVLFCSSRLCLAKARQGRSRAMHRVNAALHSAFRIPHSALFNKRISALFQRCGRNLRDIYFFFVSLRGYAEALRKLVAHGDDAAFLLSTGKKFSGGGGNSGVVHIKYPDYAVLPYGNISPKKKIHTHRRLSVNFSAIHMKNLSFGKAGKKSFVAAGDKNLTFADAV